MQINLSDYYANIAFSYLRPKSKLLAHNSPLDEKQKDSLENKYKGKIYTSDGKLAEGNFAGIFFDRLI